MTILKSGICNGITNQFKNGCNQKWCISRMGTLFPMSPDVSLLLEPTCVSSRPCLKCCFYRLFLCLIQNNKKIHFTGNDTMVNSECADILFFFLSFLPHTHLLSLSSCSLCWAALHWLLKSSSCLSSVSLALCSSNLVICIRSWFCSSCLQMTAVLGQSLYLLGPLLSSLCLDSGLNIML